MSVATELNLAIAIVNEDPRVVRGITRTFPLEDLKGLCSATSRLEEAVQIRERKAVYKAFEAVEQYLMIIEPGTGWEPDRVKAWFEGISVVEEQLEFEMEKIRKELETKS